jgi:hypothetical protein
MSAFRKLTVPEITAGWFPEIRTITITPYRTGAEAAAPEIEAIKNEKPHYNHDVPPAAPAFATQLCIFDSRRFPISR